MTRGMMTLSADWRHLVYFNYEVEPTLLSSLLPSGVLLEPYNGEHYISLVGAVISGLKVMGITAPEYQSFSQVQWQCYVKRQTPEGWLRGVYVLRRFAPQPLTQKLSHLLGDDRVVSCATRHEIKFEEGSVDHMGRPIADEVATYEWEIQGNWQRMSFKAAGLPAPMSFGGVEPFVVNRPYRFFQKRKFKVEHPEWFYWDCGRAELQAEPKLLGLEQFGHALSGPPANAFLAKGSKLSIPLSGLWRK